MRHLTAPVFGSVTALVLAAPPLWAASYSDDIDVFFDCMFDRIGAVELWVTVTGQDGERYRQGALTFNIDAQEYELDATLYPEHMEAQDYTASHDALQVEIPTGQAWISPNSGAPKHIGNCKVRP